MLDKYQVNPANIYVLNSLLKTDQYTLIEKSANCANFMATYALYTLIEYSSIIIMNKSYCIILIII